MEAFEKVLKTITDIFVMIKEFFENLFNIAKGDEEETTAAE